MNTEYAPRFVGAFLSSKSGAIEIRRVDSGGYDGDEVTELAKAMVQAKQPVSQWAVWDARPNAPKTRRDKPYTAKEFAALLSEQEVALVWCKRGHFRAPVIKVGAINEKPERAARQTVTRIGK